MITIKNKEEMKEYYVKETNAYVFEDDVEFLCDIEVEANIGAYDIKARNIDTNDIIANDIRVCKIETFNIYAKNINAFNIKAHNIMANNINANDISYYAVCVSHNYIFCNSIKGRHRNSKHFVLDGELIVGGKKNG